MSTFRKPVPNWIAALVIVGCLFAVGAVTYAVTPTPPLRLNGVTMPDGTLQPLSPSGSGTLIYNNTTHTFQASTNGGAYGSIGGGGGTLATSYSGGASQSDSTMSLDSTRLGLRIKDNASPISGSLFSILDSGGTNTYFGVTAAATGAAALSMADGSSASLSAASQGVIIYNNSTHRFESSVNGGSYGPLGLNWPIQNSTSTDSFNYGGTMTGSSTAYSFRSTNADTAGDKLMSIGGASEEVYLNQLSSGVYEWRSATAGIGLRNANGDGIIAQSANNVYIYGAGTAQVGFVANNYVTPIAGGITLGRAAAPWTGIYGYQFVSPTQPATLVASNTIVSTYDIQKLTYTSATNVTSMTISAGIDGQELVLELYQPAAGTAATMVTTWTNVNFAGGTGSFTATLGKHDVYTFVYEGGTSKWNERSRALNETN